MRTIVRATLLVTLMAVVGQVVAFVTQIATASLFGTGAGMDAFFAGTAVPQYAIAVLLGSLAMVFLPVFIDYTSSGREEEAWQVASSLINLCLLGLGALAILAVWFSDVILSSTAPGLSEPVLLQASQIAAISWPSVLATVLIVVLTGIYQSGSRFGWPAVVPVIGALLTLALLLLLATRLGTVGLAIALTVGSLVQMGLLLPLALKSGGYRLSLNWHHPGVQRVLRLLVPLLVVNLVAKSTPLVDRFFASTMPEGSISQLGYAFRIFGVLSLLLSTGIATVIFPRMALNAATWDMAGLRQTMSAGLRVMWLAIAPAMTIGIALALPLIIVVFQRGQFRIDDAVAVAGLIQVYLLALPAACLANVTGRGFFALKDTQTVAVLGSVETVAYVVYAAVLARLFGVLGLAFGYVLFFNISLAWQALVVRHKAGKVGGQRVVSSFLRTGLAALAGGAAAWGVTQLTADSWLQLGLGALLGLSVYGLSLLLLRSPEIEQVWSSLRA